MKFHSTLRSGSPFPISITRYCLVLLLAFNENKHFAALGGPYKIKGPIPSHRRPLSGLRESMQDLEGTIEGLRGRHVPRSQKDPGSWISRIQDPRSWSILDLVFSFSLGILDILDPVAAKLLWDPRDLGSLIEKILLDPGDPGSSLCELPWDLTDIGSYTMICHCILKILDI